METNLRKRAHKHREIVYIDYTSLKEVLLETK